MQDFGHFSFGRSPIKDIHDLRKVQFDDDRSHHRPNGRAYRRANDRSCHRRTFARASLTEVAIAIRHRAPAPKATAAAARRAAKAAAKSTAAAATKRRRAP